jgi:hypothetical protein
VKYRGFFYEEFFFFVIKCSDKNDKINERIRIIVIVSENELLYPKKYCVRGFSPNKSGFKLHIFQVNWGFGTLGFTWQGIRGKYIDPTRTAVENIQEYLNFFTNLMNILRFYSL